MEYEVTVDGDDCHCCDDCFAVGNEVETVEAEYFSLPGEHEQFVRFYDDNGRIVAVYQEYLITSVREA